MECRTCRDLDYSLRAAGDDDWPWIAEGLLDITRLNTETADFAACGEERAREQIDDFITRRRPTHGDRHIAFIATNGNGIRSGFAWIDCRHRESPAATDAAVIGVFVAREHRRQGLGCLLALTAMEWAWHAGAAQVTALIGGLNHGSEGFHRALGFQVEALRMVKAFERHVLL